MAVSTHYVAHAVECMARVAPVSYRRIFHGVGIYHQGVQFAIIVNDHLYFRADEYSRSLYEQRGMAPFRPAAADMVESAFYQVPEAVLERPADQNYTDISGRYIFEYGPLAGTQVSVGVRNVFNQTPPVIATGALVGGYSTFADPRLRTYSVSIRRSF